MGNTIITLLSLLIVKQGFISSMDHCDIYITVEPQFKGTRGFF